jgi:hypothetical protein
MRLNGLPAIRRLETRICFFMENRAKLGTAYLNGIIAHSSPQD